MVRRISAVTTLAVGAVIGAAGFAWLAFAHGNCTGVILAGLLTGTSIVLGYRGNAGLIAASVPLHQTGIVIGFVLLAGGTGQLRRGLRPPLPSRSPRWPQRP